MTQSYIYIYHSEGFIISYIENFERAVKTPQEQILKVLIRARRKLSEKSAFSDVCGLRRKKTISLIQLKCSHFWFRHTK